MPRFVCPRCDTPLRTDVPNLCPCLSAPGPPWIACEERLPVEPGVCLVRCADGHVNVGWYSSRGTWGQTVTHWTPLPQE